MPAPGRAVVAAAFYGTRDLLEQAIAALRAWPIEDDLARYEVTDPAALPVGAADRTLLSMHEQILGYALEYTASCTACGELTSLPLGRSDVGEHAPRCAWCSPGIGAREPTYADLAAASGDASALLARCSIGTGARLDDLARIEGSLSGPLHSTCVGCGQALVVDVDVMALALHAIGAVRGDIDREVHLIASGYGWDLATIESLPDDRRSRLATFVEMSLR